MSVGIKTYVSLFALIREEALTAQDLSHATKLNLKTVQIFLREMHKQGLAHIAQWDNRYNRRVKLPMFKLGAGTDAPKPKRLPTQIVMQRYRERRKIRENFDPFYAMCRHNVAVPDEADRV